MEVFHVCSKTNVFFLDTKKVHTVMMKVSVKESIKINITQITDKAFNATNIIQFILTPQVLTTTKQKLKTNS